MGEKAVVETRTPIIYLHYRIEPRGVASQQAPVAYNAFAYFVEGRGCSEWRASGLGTCRWSCSRRTATK
jgi:hypothetical protein